MSRTSRLVAPLFLIALLLPAAAAQTDGFLVTNVDGDTLFYAAPDGTVQFGPADTRVELGSGNEGLISRVTRADGNPSAGIFSLTNPASQATALLGTTQGTGTGTSGWAFGDGTAGGFFNYSSSNPNPSLETFTVGTGPGLEVKQLSGDLLAPLATFWSGPGYDEAGHTEVVSIRADGHVAAPSGEFRVTDEANGTSPVYGRTAGTAAAGAFIADNPGNVSSALYAQTSGTGAAIRGRALNTGPAVRADQESASGPAGQFTIHNDTNGGSAVEARTVGTGAAVLGNHEGPSGEAGHFAIRDAGNESPAVLGFTAGAGGAGYFEINDAGNANTALGVRTYGAGAAVFGHSDGGPGGQFMADVGSDASALDAITLGTGAAFRAVQNSGGGHTVAEFVTADGWANYDVVMRVATDGNVYADGAFNGGGADFAERFEVVGGPAAYEVGDVLAIATSADRHLERSAEPYSTRILGVYATRPGVLLGDPSISPEVTVPVGVVGVVPTKVTGEGGPIRRGDMLVTSSTAGHAMRGEPGRVGVGMVIGKALQDFDGARGVIEVMVNVQ